MASGSAIRAGQAFVELFADDSKLAAGLRKASAKLKAWGASIQSLGQGAMLAGAAIVAPMAASLKVFSSIGDAVDKMSTRVGTSAEFVSALSYAAKIGGTNLETMEVGIRRLQRSALDAERGLSTSVEAFNRLGVNVHDANGALKPTEQLFMETASALSKVSNNTERAALATMVFGRSGTMLLPMLQDGKAGLVGLMNEAKRLGLVLTGEDAAAAAQFTDEMTRMKTAGEMTLTMIGGSLAPVVEGWAKSMWGAIPAIRAWIDDHKELIQTALKIGVGLVALGGSLVVIGKVAAGVGGVASAARGAAMAIGFLAANPLVLLATAGVAAGVAISRLTTYTAKLSDEMQRQTEAADKQRAADLGRMDRLKELSEKENKNASEMAEAARIIDTLQRAYGGLGLSLDQTTGKVNGLAGAQGKLNARMRDAALSQIDAEIAEVKSNLTDLNKEIDTAPRAWFIDVTGGLGVFDTTDERMKSITAKIEAQNARWSALLDRRKALLTGDTSASALAGKPPPESGIPGGMPEAPAEKLDGLARRLADLRARGIEDELQRELTLIKNRYDAEVAAAQAAHASKERLALIEQARQQEIANARAEADGRSRNEAKKAADEAARRAQQQADEIAQANAERERTIEDLKLELKFGSDAKGLEQARLALEEARAIVQANFQGADAALVRREYELRKRLAGAMEGTEAAAASISVRGTFSAAGVRSLAVGGGSALNKVAANTERLKDIEKNTKRLLDKSGPLVFDQ